MTLRASDSDRSPASQNTTAENGFTRETVTCAQCRQETEAFVEHPAGTGQRLCLTCYNAAVAEGSSVAEEG